MEGPGCVPGFHTPWSSRTPRTCFFRRACAYEPGPGLSIYVSPRGRLGLQGAERFCCSPVSSSEPDPAGLSSGKGRAKAARPLGGPRGVASGEPRPGRAEGEQDRAFCGHSTNPTGLQLPHGRVAPESHFLTSSWPHSRTARHLRASWQWE